MNMFYFYPHQFEHKAFLGSVTISFLFLNEKKGTEMLLWGVEPTTSHILIMHSSTHPMLHFISNKFILTLVKGNCKTEERGEQKP